MTLPQDPHMLCSLINMKLRDEYPNLESLCAGLDIDKSQLIKTLADAGYEYLPSANAFR